LCIKHFQKLNQFTQLNLNPAYETSVLSDLLNIINLALYETFNGRNQDKKAHDKNTALIFCIGFDSGYSCTATVSVMLVSQLL